jgi:hypothetical protein
MCPMCVPLCVPYMRAMPYAHAVLREPAARGSQSATAPPRCELAAVPCYSVRL